MTLFNSTCSPNNEHTLIYGIIGFIYIGMQARHVLSGTGLPQMTLAKIWQLSDIDNDGKLSQEEFVLAMHLSDMAKSGEMFSYVLEE